MRAVLIGQRVTCAGAATAFPEGVLGVGVPTGVAVAHALNAAISEAESRTARKERIMTG